MKRRFGVAGVLVAGVIAVALLVAAPWGGPRPPRIVVLGMKDYFFAGSNPTLTFRPRERVRFVLTNDEETHVLHNFGIPALGIACGEPMRPGERREVLVTMPRSGRYAYTCCTHPGMGGTIVIAAK